MSNHKPFDTPAPETTPHDQLNIEDTNAAGSAGHTDGAESPKRNPAAAAPTDPFDPLNLGISTDYAAAINLAASAKPFEFRKPNEQEYFRVSPREVHHLVVGAILDKQAMGRVYVVSPELLPEVKREFPKHLRAVDLFVAQTLFGASLVWPVPPADGRGGKWNSSHRTGCHSGKSRWTNMAAGNNQYDIATVDDPKEVDWDAMPPFKTILREALAERFIDSLDHPLLKKLRGQVE